MKLVFSAILLLASVPAFASTITINLNGVGDIGGTPLTSTMSADPGPTGLSSALTYTLPFAGTQGDVLLFDPNLGFPGDLLRFNGNSTLVVYADNLNGLNSQAATMNPPSSLYPNAVVVNETGSEANLMATYTPGVGDPGYDASAPTYVLNASTVPEPETLWLTGFGFLALGFAAIRRSHMQRS